MPHHACRSGLLDKWQPAALVTSDIILLKLALGGFAIVRAADYADGARDSYGILEAAMPLWVWALGAWVVGACILGGIALQRHFVAWLGHSLGSGLYTMLAFAQLSAAFDRWPPAGPVIEVIPIGAWIGLSGALTVVLMIGAATAAAGTLQTASRAAAYIGVVICCLTVALAAVPADGLRGAGPLATVALLHLLLALRSGPRPMGDDDTEVVEATSAPEGA